MMANPPIEIEASASSSINSAINMTSVPLSRATADLLETLFSKVDRSDAQRLLVERCGSNLPGFADADPQSLERIRFAALKLSRGDLAALASAVDLANTDWRDLLVSAGFAHDVNAHKSWIPERRNNG